MDQWKHKRECGVEYVKVDGRMMSKCERGSSGQCLFPPRGLGATKITKGVESMNQHDATTNTKPTSQQPLRTRAREMWERGKMQRAGIFVREMGFAAQPCPWHIINAWGKGGGTFFPPA